MQCFNFLRFGEKWQRSRWAFLLAPASWIWRFVSFLRNAAYDLGIFRIDRVNIPVISVGNLSAGGSGKTPFVILLCQQFSEKKIAVIARGYGASSQRDLNDEMRVIQRHVPQAMLYQGADRVALARQAEREGAELIVLDDGFQHRKLFRDSNLLIVTKEDFRGRFLPYGRLRDGLSRIRFADAVFSYEEIEQTIHLQTRVTAIKTVGGQLAPLATGTPVGVFCGIGRPERFLKTVKELGFELVATKIRADHEPFALAELASFHAHCKSLGAQYLLCTEKDAVKMEAYSLPILYVEIETIFAHFFEPLSLLEKKRKKRFTTEDTESTEKKT